MAKRFICVLLFATVTIALAAQSEKSQFELKFNDHGITNLKFPGDKYPTDYIADEGTLGHVVIRYKMGDNDWREFSTRASENKLVRLRDDPSKHVTQQLSVIYNPQDWRDKEYYADLELTERFRAEHDALYWTIFVRNPPLS